MRNTLDIPSSTWNNAVFIIIIRVLAQTDSSKNSDSSTFGIADFRHVKLMTVFEVSRLMTELTLAPGLREACLMTLMMTSSVTGPDDKIPDQISSLAPDGMFRLSPAG